MRGVQLQNLVIRLKQMVGQSSNPSAGVDDLDAIKEAIRETQEVLYDEYDWPFLRVIRSKDMAAGQRFYDFPTDLNLDRLEEISNYWSGQPHPLTRGIGFGEYGQYDSDNDERADPVRRWDVRWTGTTPQMEVWPIPVANDQVIKFRGIRTLRPLVTDSDVCDLDDRLIVLYAAADILSEQGSKKSERIAARAQARFATMKSRANTGGADTIVYGGGAMQRPTRDHVIIRVR